MRSMAARSGLCWCKANLSLNSAEAGYTEESAANKVPRYQCSRSCIYDARQLEPQMDVRRTNIYHTTLVRAGCGARTTRRLGDGQFSCCAVPCCWWKREWFSPRLGMLCLPLVWLVADPAEPQEPQTAQELYLEPALHNPCTLSLLLVYYATHALKILHGWLERKDTGSKHP